MSIENNIKNLRDKLKEKLQAKTVVGFQCWDCDKILHNYHYSIDDPFFKDSPVSLDGYIQTFCKKCLEEGEE